MRKLFLLLAALTLSLAAHAASLDALATRADLWNVTADDFQKDEIAQYRNELPTKPFRWVSQSHDSARAADTKLTLFGLPVVEAIMRFESGKVSQLTATFYARGDAGTIPKEKYEELVRAAVAALDQATGVKMKPRGKDPANAVKADGLIWETPAAQYLLEYSAIKEVKTRNVDFRAEFVRLEITPPPRKASLLSSLSSPGKGKFTGAQHVRRTDANGDVLIPDVPMVDQGQKGYCVVACAERLMRYYGIAADANEIAQIANSDAERGTNPTAMLNAMKKVGNRLRVRVRQIETIDVKEVLALIKEYNREAKKLGQPQVADPGHMIDLDRVFHSMNGETLKAVRAKPGELTKFQREIEQHVDAGIPVLWSVRLGLIKEPEIPQAEGGHMRLIIGYNPKTQEILYTDSWGARHEKKRMALADACTITMGLATIEPLGS